MRPSYYGRPQEMRKSTQESTQDIGSQNQHPPLSPREVARRTAEYNKNRQREQVGDNNGTTPSGPMYDEYGYLIKPGSALPQETSLAGSDSWQRGYGTVGGQQDTHVDNGYDPTPSGSIRDVPMDSQQGGYGTGNYTQYYLPARGDYGTTPSGSMRDVPVAPSARDEDGYEYTIEPASVQETWFAVSDSHQGGTVRHTQDQQYLPASENYDTSDRVASYAYDYLFTPLSPQQRGDGTATYNQGQLDPPAGGYYRPTQAGSMRDGPTQNTSDASQPPYLSGSQGLYESSATHNVTYEQQAAAKGGHFSFLPPNQLSIENPAIASDNPYGMSKEDFEATQKANRVRNGHYKKHRSVAAFKRDNPTAYEESKKFRRLKQREYDNRTEVIDERKEKNAKNNLLTRQRLEYVREYLKVEEVDPRISKDELTNIVKEERAKLGKNPIKWDALNRKAVRFAEKKEKWEAYASSDDE